MTKEGVILRSTGSWYDIQDVELNRYKGRLRGKFKIKGLKVTNPIAVGDKVAFTVEDTEAKTVIINKIFPRKNYIIRKSAHKTAHGHMIAANIDLAALIVTFAFPKTSLGFIDRFLVSAEAYDIPAMLVFNKKDLLNEEQLAEYEEIKEIYGRIGYPSILISAQDDPELVDLHEVLKDKTVLLAGHSGVGKSTILNILAPEIEQATKEISSFANKGVHTTTFAEMFGIGAKTYIIDTPGIKELGVFDIDDQTLPHCFPEIVAAMKDCKYHNCSHTQEPKCAVIEKARNGEIAPTRYMSYLSILANEDNRR